jgi:hypothetical protein
MLDFRKEVEMGTRKGGPTTKDARAEVLAKAIVDPAFRKKLFANPEAAFGAKLSKADLAGVEKIKKFLPALTDLVHSLAGEILCGGPKGGGGCGLA